MIAYLIVGSSNAIRFVELSLLRYIWKKITSFSTVALFEDKHRAEDTNSHTAGKSNVEHSLCGSVLSPPEALYGSINSKYQVVVL